MTNKELLIRHKVLMALQLLPEISGICLGDVSEFDETFVLDCYKGKELDSSIPRSTRKHGAKAEKEVPLMSMCVSTLASNAKGMPVPSRSTGQNPARRSYWAYLEAISRTGPSPFVTSCVAATMHFRGLQTALLCNDPGMEDTCFYNLNTVNGFHSFIKQRYVFYRGVASKYTNRYNDFFSVAYRNAESIIKRLMSVVLTVTGTNYYHSRM